MRDDLLRHGADQPSAEAAQPAGADDTVYEWVWSGELRSTRVGPTGRSIRVSEAQPASYIDRNEQGVLARR